MRVISGDSVSRILFSARTGLFTFFFLQLADTISNFEVILAAREHEYKKRFVKSFLNVIYFRHLEILCFSSFFTVSNFLMKN